MKPVKFPGHNMTLAEDQPEYQPLPVCYQGGNEGSMTSCWKLTWRERIKILFSGVLYLNQLTFNQSFQPILPLVKWEEPKCKNCGRPVGQHKHPDFNCPFKAGQQVKFYHPKFKFKTLKQAKIGEYKGRLYACCVDTAYPMEECEQVELIDA